MLTAVNRFKDFSREDLQNLIKPADVHAGTRQVTPPELQRSARYSAPGTAPVDNPVTDAPVTSVTDFTDNSEPDSPNVATASYQGYERGIAPVTESVIEAFTDEMMELQRAATEGEGLIPLVNRVIVLAGLGNCVVVAPDMPLGFYIGFPNDGPLDLKDNARNRQAAWWVVAMASGQFEQDLCRSRLSDRDPWRRMVLDELDEHSTSLGELELTIENNIGSEGEFLPISWLMNPANLVAGLCLEILTLIRSSIREEGGVS
jgi:hypothetical protein